MRKKWSDEEIEILRKYYPDIGAIGCCDYLPGKTKKQIKEKALSSNIKSNHYKKWTEDEKYKLRLLWEYAPKDVLLAEFPERTWTQLQNRAELLGLKSKAKRYKHNDLSFLSLDKLSKNSAYWWGFIMADGHLSKSNQLIIQLNKIDEDHLKKIAEKLKTKIIDTSDRFVRISPSDNELIQKWRKMLCMENTAKTYYPPKLNIFEDFFIYFFIGFVDGDGCIWLSKNYPLLKIELHASWTDNLKWFSNVLSKKYGINSHVSISKRGTSQLTMGNKNDIIKVSKYCKDVDFLERKWNKIFNYKPTQQRKRAKTYKDYILSLKEIGVYDLKSSYEKHSHLERGCKKYGVTKEQILEDLKK